MKFLADSLPRAKFATPSACYRGAKPQKCPKWLGEGAKGPFGPREPKSSCTGAERELHRCKTGFRWCKRLLGDLCSLGPKHLLHPLLTVLGTFEVPVAGTRGRNARWHKVQERFPAGSCDFFPCENLREAATPRAPDTGKYSSKRKSAHKFQRKLPAMSGLCHFVCAFMTRSGTMFTNLSCNRQTVGQRRKTEA